MDPLWEYEPAAPLGDVRHLLSSWRGGDETEARDVVRKPFLAAQLDGTEPCVVELFVPGLTEQTVQLPAGSRVQRRYEHAPAGDIALYARCPLGGMYLAIGRMGVSVTVSAATQAAAAELAAHFSAQHDDGVRAGLVDMAIWNFSNSGPSMSRRQLSVDEWAVIHRNYPGSFGRDLGELMALRRPEGRGRLVLWHGPAGTGKTTALKTLAKAWEPWCDTHYISDPETFFGRPDYLLEVLSDRGRSARPNAGDDQNRWRMIIAEDSDEYLRASARKEAGAALGRLLNTTDGILGQGSNAIVVLTTNEETHRLHPALTRPGRCLAQIEFRRFTPDEARAWLPGAVPAPDGATTLAELYERRASTHRIGMDLPDDPVNAGMYL